MNGDAAPNGASRAPSTHQQERTTFELGERLDLALERLAELGRELERVRGDAAERESTVSVLQDLWRTVEGRTLRHEAGIDTLRELRAHVEELGERLEQESALRREAIAALSQAWQREADAADAVERSAADLAGRVAALERQTAQAEPERHRLVGALGALEEQMRQGTARLGDLELRLGASRDAEHAAMDGIGAMEARLAALAPVVGELDVRMREGEAERRVLADAVNTLRTARDRDAELLDLLEQQRATRQRIEERLMAIEEGLSAVGRALLEAAEQRAQLRMQLAGVERRVVDVTARFEEQRELLQRQWRAVFDADDAAAARMASELERRARERHELLRRLNEENETNGQMSGGAQ